MEMLNLADINKIEKHYISFLFSLHERPGCYIGHPSFEKLLDFMAGYEVAVFNLTGYRIMLQHNLRDILCEHLNRERNCSLSQLIRDETTDADRFDYFFHALSLYCEGIKDIEDDIRQYRITGKN